MSHLESKRVAINDAIKRIQFKHVENVREQRLSEAQIHSFFKSIRQQLDERYLKLKVEFAEKVNTQQATVNVQISTLQKHQQSITEALDQQNALLLNPDNNTKERQTIIDEITSNVLGALEEKQLSFNPQRITFSRNEESVAEVWIVHTMLSVRSIFSLRF